MPKAINNAEAAQALTRAYALKGRVQLSLDEMLVPVTIVDDLSSEGSPVELRPCGADIVQPNVAGEFGYVGVRTQAGFALSCEFFDAFNTGAGDQQAMIVLLSAANIATIGVTAGSLVAKDLPKDSNAVGSQFFFGSDAAELGVEMGEYVLGGEQTTRIPVGVTIYGVDNPNRVAVALRGSLVNIIQHCVASCVERDEFPTL